MRILIIVLLCIGLSSYKHQENLKPKTFTSVEIEDLMLDSLLNVRALEINEGRVVAATSRGQIYQNVGFKNEFDLKSQLAKIHNETNKVVSSKKNKEIPSIPIIKFMLKKRNQGSFITN